MIENVSYDVGCLRSLKKLPDRVSAQFLEALAKFMGDPSRHGLNIEPIEAARDRGIKSMRIDQGYRAIGYVSGKDLLFLHVNEHDKAYRWAANRMVRVDPETNRVRIVDVVEASEEAAPSVGEAAVAPRAETRLFAKLSDGQLLALGVMPEELGRVRGFASEGDLEAAKDDLDTTTYEVLYALAAGYEVDEIPDLLGLDRSNVPHEATEAVATDFAKALRSDQSRQTIFIPENETELRRVLEGDLEGWRVFLHPEQRKFAYRDYGGPVLIRGGAGTGKTVVAMHRAKYLADAIAREPERTGDKILFTTFTTNLARDIEANLKVLCPEHFQRGHERIEVRNLDAWVGDFLRRRNFDRRIAYFGFGEDSNKLEEIWDEVFSRASIPAGLTPEFVRSEWAQVIQARGVDDRKAYFQVSRAGRGTPLDRQKRAALWPLFEAYRARMIDEGIAEPDDAYREAVSLLGREKTPLPYTSVVVDEAQDMGEQAFRLIRAIVPKRADADTNSIFVVGDAHQRIYSRRVSLTACGVEVRGRSRFLRLNYRTTEDIRRWAVAVLQGVAVDDLDDGADTLSGYRSLMSGPKPDVLGYVNRTEEMAALNQWVADLVASETKLSSIGVLTRTRRGVDELERSFAVGGIPTVRLANDKADTREVDGVRLATMHRSKGLEFEAVAVVFLDNDAVPPRAALNAAVDPAEKREVIELEKSLLHVAATRAKRLLRVSWSGPCSTIIPA
jgi:superfamily I DNA/RNA helicase